MPSYFDVLRYNDCTDSTMTVMHENLEKVKGTAATSDRVEGTICDGINKVRMRRSCAADRLMHSNTLTGALRVASRMVVKSHIHVCFSTHTVVW